MIQRIKYKILLLTHRALKGDAPSYIGDMLVSYNPGRSLRSGNKLLLTEPTTNLVTYGDRSFSCAAPRLWNSIPVTMRQLSSTDNFKRSLKTYLFKEAFL